MSKFSYEFCLFFLRIIINIFFREIRPRGAWHIPKSGPVIFVAAPHHNQFLDPILLASEVFRETHRRIGFLTAASSLQKRVIGFLISMMDPIPVERAADHAKKGTGLVRLHPDDPTIVLGVGTRFTAELGPKTQILLPKSTQSAIAEVIEVRSDTEVKVRREFTVGDGAKATKKVREKVEEAKKTGKEGLDWKVLPHFDQHEMYSAVYNQLKSGAALGIFPEGGSHDRTDLLPLKAGVSIMALGAMSSNPNLQVRIVPVGLSYFHPHRFRSRAVIEFGRAFDVPPDLVDMFRQGGDSKRTATGKLLDLVYDGLKTVTVRAPDYETLMLIQASRRLYKTPGQHLTLSQVVELNKRFIEGYLHFQNEPRIQELKKRVTAYNRALRNVGLRDHQVEGATRTGWKSVALLVYRTGLLMAWTIFALPGGILHAPIFITAAIVSKKKQKEALAASTVKVAARDVIGTWKVLVSLVMCPILYTLYSAIATYIAHRCGATLKWQLLTPLLVSCALPGLGYSALKFGEAGMDVLKSLPPLILSCLPGQHKRLERLRVMRAELSNEVSDAINEFGPKLWDDFDAASAIHVNVQLLANPKLQRRIVLPASSIPPSSDASLGLWRRKSGQGGVDAQGNLLIHPMTWLDERIFGWSRSAKRGTNVWGTPVAHLHSGETSRAASPWASDEEDSGTEREDEVDGRGDWDDVIGMLEVYEKNGHHGHHGHHKARKGWGKSGLRGSYRDLRKLGADQGTVISPATAALPTDENGEVVADLSTNPNPNSNANSEEQRKRSHANLAQLAPVYHKVPFSTLTESSVTSPSGSPIFVVSHDFAEDGQPPLTSSRRRRKSSLEAGMKVQRIMSEFGRHDGFTSATEDLNRECNETRRHGHHHHHHHHAQGQQEGSQGSVSGGGG